MWDKRLKYLREICRVIHAITQNGEVFSWGEDTQNYGILGMGKILTQSKPVKNTNFRQKIYDIALGEKHCFAVDSKIKYLYQFPMFCILGVPLTMVA